MFVKRFHKLLSHNKNAQAVLGQANTRFGG